MKLLPTSWLRWLRPRDPERFFNDMDCRWAYLRQKGRCRKCRKPIVPERGRGYEADHKKPWSKGGKTVRRNLQLLCPPCNRSKGAH